MDYWGGIQPKGFSEKVMLRGLNAGQHEGERLWADMTASTKRREAEINLAPWGNFRKKMRGRSRASRGDRGGWGRHPRRRGARDGLCGAASFREWCLWGCATWEISWRWEVGGVALKVLSEHSAANSLGSRVRERRVWSYVQAPSQALPLTRPPNDEVRATGHEHCRRHPAPRPL